jgi:hypothetical protein
MIGRALAGLSVAVAMVGLGVVACGPPSSTSSGQGSEKVATTSELLVITDPTPPYVFPSGQSPGSCPPMNPIFVWLARGATASVDDNGVEDPYKTQYSHWYKWNECATGDLRCQHATDLWNIPSTNGYIYLASLATRSNCPPNSDGKIPPVCPVGQEYFIQSLAPVSQTWSWTPPTRPYQPTFGPNLHPPYGTDGKSGDWLSLWNVVYTYSSGGPNADAGASTVDSHRYECAYIVNADDVVIDYFVAFDYYDPNGHDW